MKKLMSIILIVCMVIMLGNIPSYATALQATLEITPDKTEATAGDTIIYTIKLTNLAYAQGDAVYAVEGKITYDSNFFESLTYTDITLNSSTGTGSFSRLGSFTNDSTIGTISLKIKSDATGSGNVQFTNLACNDGRDNYDESYAYTPDISSTINIKSTTVDPVAMTDMQLSSTSLTLQKGKTGKIDTTITPSNADVEITYKSANENIATVNTNGTVTAIAVGETQITVTATDKSGNTKTATCKVIVQETSTSGNDNGNNGDSTGNTNTGNTNTGNSNTGSTSTGSNSTGSNNTNTSSTGTDNTVATKSLPYTGLQGLLGIGIITLITSAIVLFTKYKNLRQVK